MVTEAIKKFRDIFAYGLLAVAALYLISALSLLFKSEDDVGLGFSGKAAVFGYLFAHPLLVFSLIAAVALAVGFGEASKNARIVILVALGIAAVSLLLGLICWFSSFGADDGDLNSVGLFGGVFGAGKIVGIFLGLAQLLLLGLAAWFAYTALQSLPKTAGSTTSAWGQSQGYADQQGYGGQQAWGQQGSGYSGQAGWGQQNQGWGAGATAAGATAAGWGDQSQAQAEQQGQPASAWTGSDQSYSGPEHGAYSPPVDPQQAQSSWGQPGQPGQPAQGWGQPETRQQQPQHQQSWGTPAQPTASGWRQSEGASAVDASTAEGSTAERPAQAEQRDADSSELTDQESRSEGDPPPQGWWQQPRQ